MEILKTLEKSHVGGWFPWGFLPAPDGLILWSIPDVCRDVDLDVLVDALRPVGPFKKIGKVFRKEEDSTVGLLQIGDGVDPLLIPRQVRLAGGVWRVLSKPATKEAAFRERLLQFLQEEGRTLDDVARVLDRSTPHPPPRAPRAPARPRVPRAAPPPPRLVVGTFDSSGASDSDDDDDVGDAGGPGARAAPARMRTRTRRTPVSYLGSKFLGSDLESEDDDDEELVQAFLRRGEPPPPAAPARGRPAHLPMPMFDNLGPQVSKADRWRQCVSQVSWGKLRRRVKGCAPRSGVEEARAPRASTPAAAGRDEGSSQGSGPRPGGNGGHVGSGGDGRRAEPSAPRWRPKIRWASFRLRRREALEVDSPAPEQAQAADSQREEAIGDQRAEADDNQREEAIGGRRVEAADVQGAEAVAHQRAEVVDNQRVEAVADQEEEAANQRAEALADQRAEAGAQAIQEAEGLVGSLAPETARSRTRKQTKTVRFQTPGRFSWFHKRRRAFWHTPRLPTLPKRVPRASEARDLRVLRAEASAEAEQGEREAEL
ncbi:coiled-coil domain-containing protein 8 isoform X2 [Dipodomys spectabilis]|uniref:coiled-coil domain-containing protein 8 isoform X2 n=1 Tax=Dipodomys spectabilis TaxID=105255 RepID=UPI001C53AE54|nr:coiled-coil domain-containing protein 8 isoform X2 [Dipodomys spectabilis]